MKIPTNSTTRAQLLTKLRAAVRSQIDLWDVAEAMAGTLSCDQDIVLSRVMELSITADTGRELTMSDLDDFLGVGEVGVIKTGGPIGQRES